MIENLIYLTAGAVITLLATKREKLQEKPTQSEKQTVKQRQKLQFENLMTFDGTERGQKQLGD